jgi:hypothetical protein
MMEEHEIDPYMAHKYMRTLVSLYNQGSIGSDSLKAGPASAASSDSAKNNPSPILSPEQEKKLLVANLKAKIKILTQETLKTKVSSPADRKQLRKIETKLDIYRSNLEKLEDAKRPAN